MLSAGTDKAKAAVADAETELHSDYLRVRSAAVQTGRLWPLPEGAVAAVVPSTAAAVVRTEHFPTRFPGHAAVVVSTGSRWRESVDEVVRYFWRSFEDVAGAVVSPDSPLRQKELPQPENVNLLRNGRMFLFILPTPRKPNVLAPPTHFKFDSYGYRIFYHRKWYIGTYSR